MEKDGQLTFSDDSVVSLSNEALSFIEVGDFSRAFERIDPVITKNPDHPGLTEIYRTARFWMTRKDECYRKVEGKDRANFLMDQWNAYTEYAEEKNSADSYAFKAARKYIFFAACEEYKTAFYQNENPTEKFENLIKLGVCFITLGEYRNAVETLEYARSSHRNDAKLVSLLAESYFHTGDIPKSLLLFREAFSIEPSSIELQILTAQPIKELEKTSRELKPKAVDLREWIPVVGYITDTFYVKRQINMPQFELLKKDILSLEKNYQALAPEQRDISNITPRLLNKYLWLYDYFAFQTHSNEHCTQIRDRLLVIDQSLFSDFFKRGTKQRR
jgi:tetratricopeptide (TPR) repeat protein